MFLADGKQRMFAFVKELTLVALGRKIHTPYPTRIASLMREVSEWSDATLNQIPYLNQDERREVRVEVSRAWLRLRRCQLTWQERFAVEAVLLTAIIVPYLISLYIVLNFVSSTLHHDWFMYGMAFLSASTWVIYAMWNTKRVRAWIVMSGRHLLGYSTTVRRFDRTAVELFELVGDMCACRTRRNLPGAIQSLREHVWQSAMRIRSGPSELPYEIVLVLEERLGVGDYRLKRDLLDEQNRIAQVVLWHRNALARSSSEDEYERISKSLLSGMLAAIRSDRQDLLENAPQPRRTDRIRSAFYSIGRRMPIALAFAAASFFAPVIPGFDQRALAGAQAILAVTAIVWLATGDRSAVDTVRSPLEKSMPPAK